MNVISQIRSFVNPARHSLDATRRLAENNVLDIHDNAALESHFFQQLQVAPQLAGIYLADETGRFVYVMRSETPNRYRTKFIPPFRQGESTHPAEFIWRNDQFSTVETSHTLTDTYEARTRPWFTSVRAQKKEVWTQPYIYYTARKPGITYAVPVLHGDGSIKAILGVDIQIDELSGFLRGIWSERRGAAIVLNENGEVLAHPSLVLIRQDADMDHPELTTVDQIDDPIARMAFGQVIQSDTGDRDSPVHTDFEFNGQRYVAMLIKVSEPELRWWIGLYAPENNFIGEIKTNRVQGIWIAIAIAVLTGLIGLALADRINQPLRTFASQTQKVSRGEVAPEEALHSPYRELDDTGEAFAHEIRKRQRSEAAYGRTFDLASRGMAQIAPEDGRFLRVNDRLCDIMGYEAHEMEDMTLFDILPEGQQNISQKFRETLLEDAEFIGEAQFLRKDKSLIWLRVNAILIRNERGEPDHSLAIVDDVSEQKFTEEEIGRLRRDLLHVARVNLMGEMASGMAHELNQPLSAISYNVDAAKITLEQSQQQDPELVEILTDIDRQAHRAGNIIRALREIVRKDRGRMAPFDIQDLARQTVSLMEPEAMVHQVTLEVIESDMPEVTGNRTQIAQVLVNLLRNAIDALARGKSGNGKILVRMRESGGYVEIGVEDNGPGIGDGTTLFEAFDTQKAGGMGLGLSICRTILKANGGRIWNEPKEGPGARFCFTLRCSDNNEVEKT